MIKLRKTAKTRSRILCDWGNGRIFYPDL